MKSKFIQNLEWRNLIKDITPFTKSNFNEQTMFGGYIGFDPTAPSLHVGNLCAIMLLKHLQLAGHKPFVLLGGFTGGIGDPAGKSAERRLLDEKTVDTNLNGLKAQFGKFLDFDCGANSAEFVNNYDWLSKLSLPDFLREVGKHINVSQMLAKDSVKPRLANGLSFTEFTYQLFQAYDFYYLYENYNCKLQMGGSDQWGNIVGGTELIRKKLDKEAFALTTGLLTKSDGGKFGKSEEGNVWLDPNLTSPFKFYQFWLNIEDAQIGSLLRIFTLKDKAEIEALEIQHVENPNALKKILAEEVTSLVHGRTTFHNVKNATEVLFGKNLAEGIHNVTTELMQEVINSIPNTTFVPGARVDECLSTLFKSSKSEVRRLIQSGAISINNIKLTNQYATMSEISPFLDSYYIVQKGKQFSALILS